MSYIYMEHLFLMFLDHTRRRTTVGRIPVDEWSARRRDLYLTTHDTHNRQISMPPVGFEPTISAGERPVTASLLRSWVRIPPGHGYLSVVSVVCCQVEVTATSWSLVQRSPTDCGASFVCDLETSRMVAPYIYDISRLRVKDLFVGSNSIPDDSQECRNLQVMLSNTCLCVPRICVLCVCCMVWYKWSRQWGCVMRL